jgi:ABC-type Fe3+ transport system permease subunit
METWDAQRKAGRLKYSDDEYRALASTPTSLKFKHQTYAYSGGGIGPAIIGTCLLVLGSIAIALSLGLLCAIYLSEYSRPAKPFRRFASRFSISPGCPRLSLVSLALACLSSSSTGASP